MEYLALAANDYDDIVEMLKPFNKNPPSFLRHRDALSEFLSISTLTAKANTDVYLIPQEDECTERPPDQCEDPCKMYKDTCVQSTRIKPFRELSKEMGNRIQGKFTTKPFDFIIHDSGSFYKLIISMTTKTLYVVFNSGSYIRDFESYHLQKLIGTILQTDKYFSVVLCGHSMGGSLALKTAELMAIHHRSFFEKCSVIAFAPFPALETDILFEIDANIRVYFTAVKINDHVYVDPWYFKNDAKRRQYEPFTLLLLDKKVREVVTTDFHPTNEFIVERFNHHLFDSLHTLSMYLNFFSNFTVGGKRKTKKNKRI
jgi:hypothetical protein